MIDVAMEDVSCPLQCPRADDSVLTGRDLLHDLPGEFSVVRCRACGLMRTNPRPTSSGMCVYYPDDYVPYLNTKVEIARAQKRNQPFPKITAAARRFIDFNEMRLPPVAAGRMLEIGCASGSYLDRMAATPPPMTTLSGVTATIMLAMPTPR